MKHSKKLLWLVGILVLVTLAGGIYFILSEPETEKSSAVAKNNLFRYQAGGLRIGLATNPSTPRVGDNQLIVEIREPSGKPISVAIDAFAEMPAMGAMPAMRATVDLKETATGHYEGAMNLSMRGEWPLTITIQVSQGQPIRLQFDLATDRAEIPIAAGGIPIDASTQASTNVSNNGMPRYRAGNLEIAIDIDPRTARVGQNKIMIEVRDEGGNPIPGIEVEAFAQMPAMGAMAAMRAPADLKQMSPVRYEGSMNLSMRGEWPLTVTIKDPQHGEKRLQFDFATDREGLAIVAGATPVDSTAIPTNDANVITIDNRRRQLIGVETDKVIHRDLVKSIRAVGEVMFDERLLSQVTLKFDGYVVDLKVNYVGARVNKNQILFTVYSPELLAAQQEYLTTLKRRQNRSTEDGLLRAARQRLALWDMSPQEIKTLEQRGSPQDYVAIYAPRSGTLIERNIVDGSAARKGQTLLTIADLSRVWIEAEVFEADLELVQVGMSATFTLPYLPGRTYPAVVEYIYPYLKSDSRTGRIRLSLENPDGVLKPDMYAEVLLEAKLGRRLSVPEEAIIIAGSSRVVFIDLGEGRLKPVRIKTGRNAQGLVEVLDGLSLGDTVVTSGNFLIAAETRLKTGIEQW
jgi:membrane fusion protein, copper/silver efflux system